MENHSYALITGATGGLGRAFVFTLAKQGYKLILTGRSMEKLIALREELQRLYTCADVRIFAADLSNGDSRYAFMQAMDGLKIGLLVNVAGVDIQKPFAQYTREKIAFQCRVNLEAAMDMCHFALQHKDTVLEIINVSSVSGIYPMPYFAIYSATKGALTSFSLALREECKNKRENVRVTAVLPGAMPTRADICQQIQGQGLWGKLAAKSPEWVAEKSLRAVRKNKRKYIPGFWNKVMRIGTAILPLSWKLRFITKRWSKISKDAF